ncbi:ATP-binding protein [Methanoculleus chikugoensis]|uniref:helicase HerA domain-containing protein n=1 Tax=Methanoculleus chikugoensis TaxID=118126 RepID=UPI001FB29A44|nr:DUF87 domain-containing protein [Methanoculleus chikugoensis]
MEIVIGKDGDRDVAVDAQELVTGRTCIIAQSGAGKSWSIAVICEQLLQARVGGFCLIDTEGGVLLAQGPVPPPLDRFRRRLRRGYRAGEPPGTDAERDLFPDGGDLRRLGDRYAGEGGSPRRHPLRSRERAQETLPADRGGGG